MEKARPKPPCKECPERQPGCHSKCAKWAAYKKADNAWKQKHQQPPEDVVSYFVKRDEAIHKLYKRRGGKKP